jgi:uncharacterized protein
MNLSYKEKIARFLELKTIAVTGVSSTTPDAANLIYRKFRDGKYHVYPINPRTDKVEDVTCYPNISKIPEKPEGVVIASPPSSALSIIKECLEQDIKYVWFHSSVNQGSLDEESARYAEDNGMTVIRTGCPMMYVPPVDFGHKCIKWILNLTGKVPTK